MNNASRILICGVNWLGDACMSMPALQMFRQRHPQAHITMLVKPPLISLWQLHPAVDAILRLEPGNAGLWKTARAVRAGAFNSAYIFPNSWRSALVPFLARIPERIGTGGHSRGLLLTGRIRLSARAKTQHQQWEYADILGLDDIITMPPPALLLTAKECLLNPPSAREKTVGLIPGAARGSSKQWPENYFIQAAQGLRQATPCRFAVFGTAAETGVCNRIAAALQPDAVSFAGRTTLPQLVASLGACNTVICNDSGGMHLAAAAGTPVVAVYGLTDALKTGPLGAGHECIRAAETGVSRTISRHDPDATRALAGIHPERVIQAALQTLNTAPSV